MIEGDSKVVVNGTMIVKGKAVFGRGSEIFIAEAAVLTIGSNFSVTGLLSLNCLKSVTFGDDCLLSWGITILDSDFHKIFDAEGTQINHDQAISIGNKVWLGNNLIILKGVTISEGIVVGSGSVVAKSLDQEKAVYAGNPPRVLRTDITWKE